MSNNPFKVVFAGLGKRLNRHAETAPAVVAKTTSLDNWANIIAGVVLIAGAVICMIGEDAEESSKETSK